MLSFPTFLCDFAVLAVVFLTSMPHLVPMCSWFFPVPNSKVASHAKTISPISSIDESPPRDMIWLLTSQEAPLGTKLFRNCSVSYSGCISTRFLMTASQGTFLSYSDFMDFMIGICAATSMLTTGLLISIVSGSCISIELHGSTRPRN